MVRRFRCWLNRHSLPTNDPPFRFGGLVGGVDELDKVGESFGAGQGCFPFALIGVDMALHLPIEFVADA